MQRRLHCDHITTVPDPSRCSLLQYFYDFRDDLFAGEFFLGEGDAFAERGAEDGFSHSLGAFAVVDEIDAIFHEGRVRIAPVGIRHKIVDLGKQHVASHVAHHLGHHRQHPCDEVVHPVRLALQRPDADSLTSYVIVLIVGEEYLTVAHPVVIIGGLGHLTVNLSHFVLQQQLGDKRCPRHGILMLSGGLGEVARIRQQSLLISFEQQFALGVVLILLELFECLRAERSACQREVDIPGVEHSRTFH